jgi:glycine/D-amino acid oxidase-like deaminating enzyme
MDYLVVGGGFAGLTLAVHLADRKAGTITLADAEFEKSSTRVAAGVIIPVTGRRMAKTHRADDVLPYTFDWYNGLKEQTSIDFFSPIEVLQIFHSPGNRNEWYSRSQDPGMENYCKSILGPHEIHPSVKAPLGGIVLSKCAVVNPQLFRNAVHALKFSNLIFEERRVLYEDVKVTSEDIYWLDQKYDVIIFCEGSGVVVNPFFNYVPLNPAKGEIIDFVSQELDDRQIINGNVFIVPIGNGQFRAGSTYAWDDLTNEITSAARETLVTGVKTITNVSFSITGHQSGIRPAMKDRRPVLGLHPIHSQVAIFNGLGTKGAMLAPFYAHQLCELLLNGKLPDSDVNVSRFNELYPVRPTVL